MCKTGGERRVGSGRWGEWKRSGDGEKHAVFECKEMTPRAAEKRVADGGGGFKNYLVVASFHVVIYAGTLYEYCNRSKLGGTPIGEKTGS